MTETGPSAQFLKAPHHVTPFAERRTDRLKAEQQPGAEDEVGGLWLYRGHLRDPSGDGPQQTSACNLASPSSHSWQGVTVGEAG